jgi:hypothetical protein
MLPMVPFWSVVSTSSRCATAYISDRRLTTASFVLVSFWARNSFSTNEGFLSGSRFLGSIVAVAVVAVVVQDSAELLVGNCLIQELRRKNRFPGLTDEMKGKIVSSLAIVVYYYSQNVSSEMTHARYVLYWRPTSATDQILLYIE